MIFKLLDEIFPCVLSNLIISFIRIDQIHCTSFSRIYTNKRDRFDLPIPHTNFLASVWTARFYHLDSCSGVRLEAARYIKLYHEKSMVIRRIFSGLQMSIHSQCNSGFQKALDGGIPDTTESNFIKQHWKNDWLPQIFSRLEQLSELEIHRSGIGVIIAEMIKISTHICDNETNQQTLEQIALRDEKFKKCVWNPGELKVFYELKEFQV